MEPQKSAPDGSHPPSFMRTPGSLHISGDGVGTASGESARAIPRSTPTT
jgi:hypothetical protein